MDLSKILSVSGKPDLYKHIAQSRNGIIIESLADGKRMNAFASMRISALQDIAIYTDEEDVPLEEVFRSIYKKTNGEKAVNHKADNKAVKALFEEVLPNYDRERVYVSDMKRVFKWFNILQELGLVDDKEPEKTEDDETKLESVSKQESGNDQEETEVVEKEETKTEDKK